jgi:hypothetical protein
LIELVGRAPKTPNSYGVVGISLMHSEMLILYDVDSFENDVGITPKATSVDSTEVMGISASHEPR